MSVYCGSFTPNATGPYSIEIPFLADEVELTLSARNGNNPESANNRLGVGFATADYTSAEATLSNSNGNFCKSFHNSSDICLVGLGTPGGSLSAVFQISHDSFEDDSGTYYWNFNVDTYNSSYPFQVSAKFRA